jgi:MYXO-CTERM domain-containing protein
MNLLAMHAVVTVAAAHGGPPVSEASVTDDRAQGILLTSHGFLFEDGGWDWVCEEVLGDTSRTAAVWSGDALVVATSGGIIRSTSGCDWTWIDDLQGVLVFTMHADPQNPTTLWAATLGGLWRSNDAGLTFTFEGKPTDEASVRSMLPAPDGTLYVLGFDGATPTVWIGGGETWTSATLPTVSGRLEALASDNTGRAYARFPLGSGADTLLRISPDATIEELLVADHNIAAFVVTDTALHVSLRGLGVLSSTDDGGSWSEPATGDVECLVPGDDGWTSCPAAGLGVALQTSTEPQGQWGWQPTVHFADVVGPRCAPPTDAGRLCADLWPTVAQQLGISDVVDTASPSETDTTTPPVSDGCGCQSATAPLAWPLLLLLTLVGHRRARWPQLG